MLCDMWPKWGLQGPEAAGAVWQIELLAKQAFASGATPAATMALSPATGTEVTVEIVLDVIGCMPGSVSVAVL